MNQSSEYLSVKEVRYPSYKNIDLSIETQVDMGMSKDKNTKPTPKSPYNSEQSPLFQS